MRDIKYYIRTIGDQCGEFVDSLERGLSGANIQEAAVSNKSGYIFPIEVESLAVSIVYVGPYDQYFEKDQVSELNPETGRRQKLNGDIADLIRKMLEDDDGDEVWINLTKVKPIFATIHGNKPKNLYKQAKKMLADKGIQVFEFGYEDEYKAKDDVDEVYRSLPDLIEMIPDGYKEAVKEKVWA